VLKEKPEIKKEEDLIEHKIEAENVPKVQFSLKYDLKIDSFVNN